MNRWLLPALPAKGFHAACAVPWSKLSPANRPLPVTDCYRGGLLQVENDAACGRQTGPLWINSRWVVTSAEIQDTHAHAVVCQQLETGAWAGTRDVHMMAAAQGLHGLRRQPQQREHAMLVREELEVMRAVSR